MAGENATMIMGWRSYGMGVTALALVSLGRGNFNPGQPMPKGFPDRTAPAYASLVESGLRV